MLNLQNLLDTSLQTATRINNNRSSYITNPFSMSQDKVSFSGNVQAQALQREDDINLIKQHAKRNNSGESQFYDTEINSIANAVTEKNRTFLKDLLLLQNNSLNSKDIVELLDYINLDSTDVRAIDSKIRKFRFLKHVVSDDTYYAQSDLPEYFKYIPGSDVKNFIKSDILLGRQYTMDDLSDNSSDDALKNSDFRLLPSAYNATTKYYLKAQANVENFVKKHPNANKDILMEQAKISVAKKLFTILLFNTVFDEEIANEILYNKSQYTDLYKDRLMSLSKDELQFLRNAQTRAIKEDFHSEGTISTGAISLDDKVGLVNLLASNREIINSGHEGLNFNDYVTLVNSENPYGNFLLPMLNVKVGLSEKILNRLGADKAYTKDYMNNLRESLKAGTYADYRDKFWDVNFIYLLTLTKNPLFRSIVTSAMKGTFRDIFDTHSDKVLRDPVLQSVKEDNISNERIFKSNNLDYDRWMNPTIKPLKAEFSSVADAQTGAVRNKTFTVKLWNRSPQESLFDGNYTTCCTGIDKTHGNSFVKFLTNTCTNTIEVRTDKNKVMAMSRVFWAKINGKTSLIIENIEVNNRMAKHYLYNDKNKQKFREMIFDYIRAYAKDVGHNIKDEIPVYFSAKYYKVKEIEKGLEKGKIYSDVDLIGAFPDRLYINSHGGCYYQITDDGDEFSLELSDVTKKTAQVIEDNNKKIKLSDSSYNFQDTERFN